MSLFVYKCDTCGREAEEFRKVEDREKEKDCGMYDPLLPGKFITEEEHRKMVNGTDKIFDPLNKCPGKLIFQPIQKTNFYFNFKGKQYAN